jgi:hypothetical protein
MGESFKYAGADSLDMSWLHRFRKQETRGDDFGAKLVPRARGGQDGGGGRGGGGGPEPGCAGAAVAAL